MSTRNDKAEAQEGFVRGFHHIPDDEKLRAMSFTELADLLASCEKDSPKFLVVERELKKHIAKDQAEINQKNIIVGACIGGLFGLAGVVLGAWLKDSPPAKQVAPAGAVQQMEKSNLTVKPLGGNTPQIPLPAITQPPIHPAPVQNNGQASKSVP
jgi:hypothetical protein